MGEKGYVRSGYKAVAEHLGNPDYVDKMWYESDVTVYECEKCKDCEHKEKCARAKGNKRLHVSKKFASQREKSLKTSQAEKGFNLGQTAPSG